MRDESIHAIPSVAYFSMEIALEEHMPTYSGGLGVLAGDSLRAAADANIPMVGVTLLHRKGYFSQSLDGNGAQHERPSEWDVGHFLEALEARVEVMVEGRAVAVRAWRYRIQGVARHIVPVYFLDTDLPENSARHRALTDCLYGGNDRYRLCQEAVLGLGGAAMLRALGHDNIQAYHMNEGHSALLALAVLQEVIGGRPLSDATDTDVQTVREMCVFTTHTPVPAGMDKFPLSLVNRVLGQDVADALQCLDCCVGGTLNMTYLAMAFSHYINGVSMRHEEIAHTMFPQYPINAITNGVHAATWASAPFAALFDRHIPQWRHDNLYLRYMISVDLDEIAEAHKEAKRAMLDEVARRSGMVLDGQAFTIGFARRATAYKRADLLFTDLDRLRRIAREAGPLQVLYAGKAHPKDEGGQRLIKRVFQAAKALKGEIAVVYLEDYGLELARFLCSGVDLWLNTPLRPQEASGTSGMKAALNGVPSLSVLDGWWIEGCLEGVTGWAIGDDWSSTGETASDATSLYEKLESSILPMFLSRQTEYAKVMRAAIAVNGAYYNAERVMVQYLENAYWPRGADDSPHSSATVSPVA